jgi:hypothetical protein
VDDSDWLTWLPGAPRADAAGLSDARLADRPSGQPGPTKCEPTASAHLRRCGSIHPLSHVAYVLPR